MKLLYKGKTKDVYEIDADTVLLQFKDDVTGENGVFDPGANTVGLSIDGMGKSGLRLTEFFFKKLSEKNIPTHFISADIGNATMTVQKAEAFGKGLEVICRYKAVGSFLRRYGMYAKEGQDLDAFVEVTLKDDARNDPPITKDALAMLNLLSHEEYDILKKMTKKRIEGKLTYFPENAKCYRKGKGKKSNKKRTYIHAIIMIDKIYNNKPDKTNDYA
jgi:phosphoribosylaminoimidazole-succinocarboxamide synthase